MVSLASLEEVATKAETLRSFLRGAFLDDAPRLEVTIFNYLREVLNSWLEPLLLSSSSECSSQSLGGLRNIIEQYYLQEIFAALLFLADETFMQSGSVSIAEIPKLKNSSVQDSAYYVDFHTKQYCGEMLLYLCFSRICRTHHVVRALYPLLLSNNGDDGVSQNHVSEGLFTSPRFFKKKKIISNLLNGVVLGLSDGVSAVVRVLLLDDRVKDDMTADAAKHIAHLFVTPLRSAWILQESLVVKYCENFSIVDQVRLLSEQLVNLTVFHAETPENKDNKEELKQQMPLFLQKQQNLKNTSLLKPETLEERLHICVATIINTAVHLYPHSEGKNCFDRSYKYFSLYNKYLLTPSFRALSLQSVTLGCENDEVLLALRRFAALANGSTLGPSTRGLLLTLAPISPGLLQLIEFGDTIPTPHRDILHRILDSLWKMEIQFEEMAYIFIRGAFVTVRGSFTIDRVQLAMSVNFSQVSSSVSRLRGLQRLILHERTPTDFICKVLEAGARECQQRAASSLSVGIQKKEKLNTFLFTAEELESEDVNKDEDLMLVRMIEEMCIGMNADILFGTRVTLDRVCDVLSTVATISPVCWKWVMLLLPRILGVDVIHSIFSQYSTTAESCKPARALLMRLKRLEGIIAAISDEDFVSESSMILRNAVAAVQQYDTVMSEEEIKEVRDATKARCFKIARSIEESLNAKSTSTLVVHLLALAQIAEENAWNMSKSLSEISNKDSNSKADNNNNSNNNTENNNTIKSIQKMMWLLARVLAEVDDACAAVNACKTIVWWSLARKESLDSSFIGELIINLLNLDESNPLSFRSVIPSETVGVRTTTTAAALLPQQVSRLKVRLLDVLLGLSDYDAEGRTLRNIDDYCKKTRRCSLYDILIELCKPQVSDIVQVATMHFLGHYVVATYPRVSLSSTCVLCVDVFRHTPHEMAKAACASMLSNIVISFESMGVIATLSDVDVTLLHNMAEAFRSYRCAAISEGIHEEVIHQHGDCIRDVLQRESLVVREI
ncbi:hypothetical protein LSM04_006917 [Trypanosoma melophagium]|uniref:uncharacterized protein n=1 Tax=Trypanosoma melophagium TaxID=715481 RepID=UPI003519DEE3|nr:hypothetical protein LSM04_006917 [Trypanosoma melophagium]